MAAPEGNNYAVGNEGGRPTLYKQEYNEVAHILCLKGATDAELADYFDVTETTINNWKEVHEEFFESIKKGKSYADAIIAQSLYQRAKGCTITVQQAIKLTTKTPNEHGKIAQIENIEIVDLIQEVPPDTTAAIFWLKNRQPKEWKDKTEKSITIDKPVIIDWGDEREGGERE